MTMNSTEQQNPIVSVIIPVYNMEDYLLETVSSVTASTIQNIEIVIVDDGSVDGSPDIAKTLASGDSRIHFYEQHNAGASVARNHGVRKATGKYILPLDADDLIMPDYLEKAVEALEQNPEIKLVASNASFFGEKTGIWTLPAFSLRGLARRNLMNNCSMYRKSDWEIAGGYCEVMRGREDWDFWISLLKGGGEVYRLPIIGLKYRIRKNSKRVRARRWKQEIINQLNERHPEFFEEHLGGKLRYVRELSIFLNYCNKLFLRIFTFCKK